MLSPGMRSEDQTRSDALPLFRPEALAERQQKFYGEILLIRPFSLTFFSSLGTAIAAVVLGFLLLGHYTERIHVVGTVGSSEHEAELYVPQPGLALLHPGDRIVVRCRACTLSSTVAQNATVTHINSTAISPEEASTQLHITAPDAMYKVVVTLAPQATPPGGTRVEADLPVRRRSLLQWLFGKDHGA